LIERGDELRTEYRGPSTTSAITVGGLTVHVVRPLEPDRMLDDPTVATLNRDEDYMPYWAYLWPGAFLRAGETALEIGCGLGLAGLVGMARGLYVRFTDYDSAPLAYVRKSVEANGWNSRGFSTGLLDWRDLPDSLYPVVLGADVLYESRLVPLVADVLARTLAPGGEAYIADPYRVAAEDFPRIVRDRGMSCEVERIETISQEHGVINGTLHRVQREVCDRESRQ